MLNAGRSFAPKKESKTTTDYFGPNKKNELAPLISDIALPLRRPSVLDIRLMMSSKERGQEKCQICHPVKAPITGADFFSEGRYCPSCERPMHLSCSAMWAKKTEYKEMVFRCPFCYFLLELPLSASKLVEDKPDNEPKIKLIDESGINTTRMRLIPESQIDEIDVSCTFCPFRSKFKFSKARSMFNGLGLPSKSKRCQSYILNVKIYGVALISSTMLFIPEQ